MTRYASREEGPEVVLAAGIRSPWARAGGAFREEDAGHLAAHVVRELLARTGVDPAALDEVVLGCVGPPHDQANLARVAALRADIPWSVPARTVARNCASGMESVTSAVTSIQAGQGSLYLCGGVEVMSAYPLHMGRAMTKMFAALASAKSAGARMRAAAAFRPTHLKPRVALLEGLRDPTTGLLMGQTAELIARDFGITREACDQFALESHQKAEAAQTEGRFDGEVMPHMPRRAPSSGRSLRRDDSVREGQSLEKLAKLRPYFEKPDGIVTVGNSCGITDGACALLVGTAERVRSMGLRPLAKIRSWAWSGLDPARMGLGPVHATAEALDAAGCVLGDMDVVELNEAFAAQVLACAAAFESQSYAQSHLGRTDALGFLDPSRLNRRGGAIALGHPVGATGARLLLTAAHQLSESDGTLALATLCIGGGQGGALILERMAA